MKMTRSNISYTLAVPALLYLLLCLPVQASACVFEERTMDENFELAPEVFIGHVANVRGREVVFHIDKSIKGMGYKKKYTITKGASTCHIDFYAGSYWLYMGDQIFHGTTLLYDDFGRPIEPTATMVKEKFGFDLYANSPSLFAAVAVDACSPRGGSAFFVRLKQGLTANVYSLLDKYEGSSATASFKTGHEGAGGAVIFQCNKDGKECGPRLNGSVGITDVTKESVRGYIELLNSASGSIERFNFQAQRVAGNKVCK